MPLSPCTSTVEGEPAILPMILKISWICGLAPMIEKSENSPAPVGLRRPEEHRSRAGSAPSGAADGSPPRLIHDVQKIRLVERLGDEIESPALERADGGLDGAEGRDDDHRQLRIPGFAMLEDRHPAGTRHVEIGHHRVEILGGHRFVDRGQSIRDVVKHQRLVPDLLEHRSDHVSDVALVIDDQDATHSSGMDAGHSMAGNITEKRVKRPSSVATSILPRCASTIFCEIESPSPVPLGEVVKKGMKSFSRCSFLIPVPLSSTDTIASATLPPPSRSTDTRIAASGRWLAVCAFDRLGRVLDQVDQYLLKLFGRRLHANGPACGQLAREAE